MLDWAPLCKNQFWYFQLISSCVSNATFGFLQSKSKSAFISFDEFEFKVPLSQPIKLLFEFILGYIIYNPSQVNQDIFVLWAFASGAKSWDLQRKYMSYIRTHLKKKNNQLWTLVCFSGEIWVTCRGIRSSEVMDNPLSVQELKQTPDMISSRFKNLYKCV